MVMFWPGRETSRRFTWIRANGRTDKSSRPLAPRSTIWQTRWLVKRSVGIRSLSTFRSGLQRKDGRTDRSGRYRLRGLRWR